MNKQSIQLQEFFKKPHPQSTFYTCGPAVVKMVADYYIKGSSNFQKTDNIFLTLNNEKSLTKLFKTDKKYGTDAEFMATKLKELGCYIDFGQVPTENTEQINTFPLGFKNLLDEGIPIIVNYTYHLIDNRSIGHFGIIYGINDEEILISDSAAHFQLARDSKTTMSSFLLDWKSGSGLMGIYLIIYPNEFLYKICHQVLIDNKP